MKTDWLCKGTNTGHGASCKPQPRTQNTLRLALAQLTKVTFINLGRFTFCMLAN